MEVKKQEHSVWGWEDLRVQNMSVYLWNVELVQVDENIDNSAYSVEGYLAPNYSQRNTPVFTLAPKTYKIEENNSFPHFPILRLELLKYSCQFSLH